MSAEHGSYTCVARREIDRLGLVNMRGLARTFGVAVSTAHAWTHAPGFPAPVSYQGSAGPMKLWFLAEVEAWRTWRS